MSNNRKQAYTKFQADAEILESSYRKALEELSKRDDLSAKGRGEIAAKLAAERVARVERLQAVAATAARLDREHYSQELAKAKASEVERLRRVLGDVVLAQVYERRMSTMPAQAILDWHASAVDEWESTIVAQMGASVLLSRKPANDEDARQIAEAVKRLLAVPQEVADLEDALADLRDADGFVQQLDVHAYHAALAPRLGVSAAYMPLPLAGAQVAPMRLPAADMKISRFTEYQNELADAEIERNAEAQPAPQASMRAR